jgi:hypothetical protein
MKEIPVLQWRLAEAINWCTSRVNIDDPEHCLRSPETHPIPVYRPEIDDWQKAVNDLITKRANLLQQAKSYPTSPAKSLNRGRLFLFFPFETLSDGAAENASDGFLDFENTPPWDTWLALLIGENAKPFWSKNLLLICWVPAEFEDLANDGINVNPESCICWGDALDEKYDVPDLEESKLLPILEGLLAEVSGSK